ncbi:hypothetical protein ACFYYH_11580 [Streptomyces sp. NPDC002018]|uniref:hypothetical protein n=1 Tax=Streptomyces sp. NPDC002018 TaxID=3364629 RepID=UPI0036BDEB2B
MHRVTLWISSTATLAVLGVLIAYQLHIGIENLPPISIQGSGAAGGNRPDMSQVAEICKNLNQRPGSAPGFPAG